MPASLQLSDETKAFIQARLGAPGAPSNILAALSDPQSSVFYQEARYPVTLPSVATNKE